jgi:RNA polymerase sigma factor (sigma-70 family)
MLDQDLITACIKNDKIAKKQFYKAFHGKVAAVTLRYSKNKNQSQEIIQKGFAFLFSNLSKFKPHALQSLEDWVRQEIILFTVDHLRNIRSEYYVASTVRVSDVSDKSFDLFLDNNITDFKNIDFEVLVKSLQQLVPSQRLVFNLHVVEEYDLQKIAGILEASEQTVKSNLEKARYNLQKNIDKNTKQLRNEQLV